MCGNEVVVAELSLLLFVRHAPIHNSIVPFIVGTVYTWKIMQGKCIHPKQPVIFEEEKKTELPWAGFEPTTSRGMYGH